jgi:GNAT superfamily N-acetyltransferase
MEMQIRAAGPGDEAAVARLTAQLGYEPVGIEDRLDTLYRRPGDVVLVAETGGEVVGWVHAHDAALVQVPRFAELGGLVVAEEHRGRGVGEALLQAAEAWAATRGHREVRLRSNAVRERAHRFYFDHGYEVEKTSLTFRKRL